MFAQCSEKNIVNVPGQGIFFLSDEKDLIETRMRQGGWEKHIQYVMHKYLNPNKNVIDIGAYIGSHTVHLAKGLKNGIVYAFEPQWNIRRKLEGNLMLNQINNARVFPYALGPENEIASINYNNEDNKGGAHICSKNGTGRIKNCVQSQNTNKYSIEVRSLDSFNFSNIGLIKIDVEGFELQVLKGAKRTIEASRPIMVIETYGKSSFGSTEKNKRDVMALLKKLHYSVYHIAGADYLAMPTERVTLNFGKQ